MLYGVPEEKGADAVPLPKNLAECGQDLPPGIASDVENIIQDTVQPPLPELTIRVVRLAKGPPNAVLLVHHPESWNKPHMLEGYNDKRYYKRGNFCSVRMSERQVEAAYAARSIFRSRAEDFFKSGDFRSIPDTGVFLRVVVVPRLSHSLRQELSGPNIWQQLELSRPMGRKGDWVPFLGGWSFRSYPEGDFHGRQYEFRIFENGAVSLTSSLTRDIQDRDGQQGVPLQVIEKELGEKALPYVVKHFRDFQVSGPISVAISLNNVAGYSLFYGSTDWMGATRSGFPAEPSEDRTIRFMDESSTGEMTFSFGAVARRLVDRLVTAFGYWRPPES